MALAALCALLLAGCSEATSLAQLPDVSKLPEKVLSKDEQRGKVTNMIEKGQRHRNEAVREIEEDR